MDNLARSRSKPPQTGSNGVRSPKPSGLFSLLPLLVAVGLMSAMPLRAQSDLVSRPLSVTSPAVSGGYLRVVNMMSNIGDAPCVHSPGTVFILATDPLHPEDGEWLETHDSYDQRLAAGESRTNVWSLLLPSVPPGTYYLSSLANADYEEDEANDYNNLSAPQPVQIILGLDLALSEIHSTPVWTNGFPAKIHTVLDNRGLASPSDYVYVSYYLSSDPVITIDDYFVGGNEYYLGTLGSIADDQWTEGQTAVPAGTYYLGAIIDSDGVRLETDESNNMIVGHQVEVRALSDFVLLSCTTPATAVGGEPVFISAVVTNAGADYAVGSLGVYLSPDPIITTNDLFLAAGPVLVLDGEVNSGATTQFSFLLPNSVASGSYYIGAIMDYGGNWSETNELNNSLPGKPIEIGVQADFALTAFTVPLVGSIGGSLSMPVTITNIGARPVTEPFYVGCFASTNPFVTTNDFFLGESRLYPSLPNARWDSSTFSLNATLNPALPAGAYYIGAIVDWRNGVAESTKSNNVLIRGPVQFRLAYDLAAISVTSGPVAGPGGWLWITNTIANIGLESPSVATVDFYLSSDPHITTADYRLGGDLYGAPLGQQRTFTSFRRLPQDIPPGTYYIGFIFDPQNAVHELDKSNNAVAGNLVQVRGALPVTLIDARRNGSTVLVRFASVPGCAYTLQRATSLRPPIAWKTLPDAQYIFATDDMVTVSDAALPTARQQFYQLILER